MQLIILPISKDGLCQIKPNFAQSLNSHFHKSGEYTAKAGYISLQSSKVQSTVALLNNNIDGWNWNKYVWPAHMLPKLRCFYERWVKTLYLRAKTSKSVASLSPQTAADVVSHKQPFTSSSIASSHKMYGS